jgi:hypothetical protein
MPLQVTYSVKLLEMLLLPIKYKQQGMSWLSIHLKKISVTLKRERGGGAERFSETSEQTHSSTRCKSTEDHQMMF